MLVSSSLPPSLPFYSFFSLCVFFLVSVAVDDPMSMCRLVNQGSLTLMSEKLNYHIANNHTFGTSLCIL